MTEETIQLADVVAVIRRNALSVGITMLLCLGIALLAAFAFPKRYQSKAVLDIPSSYFRNPLVSDLISELTDPSELSAQRNGLLRLALSDAFLDSVGEKYQIFRSETGTPKRVMEREYLLRKIQYFSLNPTSFQITFQGSNPQQVYELLNEVLNQMTSTLIDERYKNLTRARDAIQNQAEFLNQAILNVGAGLPPVAALQDELKKIEGTIRTLQDKFTPNHPELARLRQQAEVVRDRLRQAAAAPPRSAKELESRPFTIPNSKQPIQDIYNDLLKKLTHLNIILEMGRGREDVSYLTIIEKPQVPIAPTFPNRTVFLLVGVVTGIALSFMQVAYVELKRAVFLPIEKATEILGLPLLGELPILVSKERQLLLTGPTLQIPAALPTPEAHHRKDGGE